MHEEQLKDLIAAAQEGNEEAREKLIRSYRTFIVEIASRQCRRNLEWENDDELSIGLQAFNQAIDNFNNSYNKKFQHYAAMIIKSRLIDYFRKESRHHHLPFDGNTAEGGEFKRWEVKASWEKYWKEEEVRERAEEMRFFEHALKQFGISLQKLERSSPVHRDTRERLVDIARVIVECEKHRSYLNHRKRLPLKQLEQTLNVSRKVLKRGRNYIIALFLIMTREEFSGLRDLFSLEKKATCKVKFNSKEGNNS